MNTLQLQQPNKRFSATKRRALGIPFSTSPVRLKRSWGRQKCRREFDCLDKRLEAGSRTKTADEVSERTPAHVGQQRSSRSQRLPRAVHAWADFLSCRTSAGGTRTLSLWTRNVSQTPVFGLCAYLMRIREVGNARQHWHYLVHNLKPLKPFSSPEVRRSSVRSILFFVAYNEYHFHVEMDIFKPNSTLF